MSKKILYVVNVDFFFVSHRLPIALEALKCGYKVHIACGVINKKDYLESLGFTVHPLSIKRRSRGVLNNLSSFIEIYKLFRSVAPDLVHLISVKPVIFGGLAARLLRVPCVVYAVPGFGYLFIANSLSVRALRAFVSFLYSIALSHKNSISIFQNKTDMKAMIQIAGLNKADVALIRGSGVDLKQFSPSALPDGQRIVMLPSRLYEEKGIREFFGAAKLVKEIRNDLKFVLVGAPDSDNPKSIEADEIQKWVSNGYIEWWGHKIDMHKVIPQASLIVLPSYREGLPKALIEAAACGRAVVTTDVPGCRDAIQNNKTGFLVPVRDPRSLSEAILKIFSSQVLMEDMGVAGRKFAEENFDVLKVVEKHMSIYSSLLSKKYDY